MQSAGQDASGSVVWSAIWRARWVVVAAALIGGIGGYLISDSRSPVYSASSRIVLAQSQAFDPLGTANPGDPTRYISNQVSLISTAPVLGLAAQALDDGTSPAGLAGALEVSGTTDNDVITVRVSGPSAESSVARTDAVVAAYQQYAAQLVTTEAAAAQAATTDPVLADQIRTQAAVYRDGIQVVEPAALPTTPSSPNPVRDGALLAAIAALVAIGVSLWRRPPTGEAIPLDEVAGTRQLATVPVPAGRTAGSDTVDPADYSLAGVSLEYARQGTPGAVLLTGASAASGTDSVALGLALSAATEGKRVLLVDGDPNGPALAARLGATATARDLTAAADPEVDLADVLVHVPTANGKDVALTTLGLAAGTRVVDESVAPALARLGETYDLVLLRVGPISNAPMAFATVRHAGSVVAVVGAQEDASSVESLRQMTDVAQRPLIGMVVTRPTRGRRTGSTAVTSNDPTS